MEKQLFEFVIIHLSWVKFSSVYTLASNCFDPLGEGWFWQKTKNNPKDFLRKNNITGQSFKVTFFYKVGYADQCTRTKPKIQESKMQQSKIKNAEVQMHRNMVGAHGNHHIVVQLGFCIFRYLIFAFWIVGLLDCLRANWSVNPPSKKKRFLIC